MLAITGANGHLGTRMLKEQDRGAVRALVRSRHAAEQVSSAAGSDAAVRVVDYRDADGLAAALEGCTGVVHLVGILKETAASRYADAHERSCAALADAAARAGVGRIVYLSILGAAPDAANACLASRAAAEQILREGPVPVTVIRVPMVLGEGDYASRALCARARRPWNLVLRPSSLEQPLYAGDVVAALRFAVGRIGASELFELAGPESLPRSELIRRAAAALGRRTRVVPLPLGVGLAGAALLERLSANPPVTRAMLGVLDHDDCIDPSPGARALEVALTPLDETLRRCVAEAST
ncbi:MAG TPA: NAD(P)H-binding protein [Pseudomonadales bacterium]